MFGAPYEEATTQNRVRSHENFIRSEKESFVMPIRKRVFSLEDLLTRSMAGQQAYQGIWPDSRLLYYDHQRAKSGNIIYAK